MYRNCRNEVTDNLVKQAKTICKPSKEDFEKYFEEFNIESNAGLQEDDITVPYHSAHEFHNTWIKIQNDHQAEVGRLRRAHDSGDMSAEDRENFKTI